MTPREIIQRTLDYSGPERVAHSFGESDMVWASQTATTPATDWVEVGGGRWERTDEWGNTWARIDNTSKGEVTAGVLSDLRLIEDLVLPDFSHPEDYDSVRKERAEHPDHWLIGSMPGFTFNIARKMRKLDQYFMDLILEPARMTLLHDRIDSMLVAMIENYAAAGVDSIMFPEDWGTQRTTLINPKLWRKEFAPRTTRLCEVAHEAGIKVFMHSCGQIEPIVPGLIAAGIDLLQFDQPDLHGIDTLAERQKQGKITFWCPVDIQTTLQTRDAAIIEAKALEMLDKLWKGRGGFVAGFYGDEPSIGLEPKWQQIASDTFTTFGVRSRYL